MATDATVRPVSYEDPVPPRAGGAFGDDDRLARPAPRRRGPASWMRRLIGVREDVMDWEPEDRTKYAWFGVIVFNTALQGGISMAVALSTVRSELPTAAKVLIAVVWFWIVLGLDSWLVSSTHGVSRARLLALLPRLMLSVLLSLFVAEPLLLQIFDKEIKHQIAAVNLSSEQAYAGQIVRCNPTDGTVNTAADCLGFQLHVAGSPTEVQRQIASNAADVTVAQKSVDDFNAALNVKLKDEQKECAPERWIRRGAYWDTTTTCENIRKDIVAFRAGTDINALNARLKSVKDTAATLATQERTAGSAYQAARQSALDKAIADHTATLDSGGLLTRADALSVVAWSTWYAGFVTILIHLILVVVDAMPVLAKLMSGPTRYDRALARRQTANQELHLLHLDVEKVCAHAGYEFEKHVRTQRAETGKRRVDHDLRLQEAELAHQFRAELDARTERILRSRS
ncbi:DUF4407 domain-containing protein [Catenulispora yoronensis]|uniref:DUF4407 domain-containing protein n=1 Tax=Catenulispora yoronensis TaxID=450799 RepID=A0ABN2ULE7_9ACTN